MQRVTDLAHLVLRNAIKPGAVVIDATVGNGHDTRFLAELVGQTGRVFGFDVQESALAASRERLDGLPNVTMFHAGHERLIEHIPDDARKRIAAVMFILGYLPSGNKEIMTRADTTLAGLGQALACLQSGGLVTMVLYPGHPGGNDEAEAVRAFARRLPAGFTAHHTARINSLNPAPELLVIERAG